MLTLSVTQLALSIHQAPLHFSAEIKTSRQLSSTRNYHKTLDITKSILHILNGNARLSCYHECKHKFPSLIEFACFATSRLAT
jgi:hypothetical protein